MGEMATTCLVLFPAGLSFTLPAMNWPFHHCLLRVRSGALRRNNIGHSSNRLRHGPYNYRDTSDGAHPTTQRSRRLRSRPQVSRTTSLFTVNLLNVTRCCVVSATSNPTSAPSHKSSLQTCNFRSIFKRTRYLLGNDLDSLYK